jgi:glycosyltransferase domain-containing protein
MGLSDTTIIIPTLDRHGLLLRAINYYQHFDCSVLIVDSSDSKLNHKFPNNIIYKHLPKTSWTEKIYSAAKDIITPYVCLVADDDYLLESSLKEGTFFLGNNPEYASTQGRYYGFELTENQVDFSPRYNLSACHYAVESENRYARLAKTFNPYFHQIYSVHRTNLFTKGYKFASVYKKIDWENFPITELIHPLVPMCYGKHKVLPILWMARDNHIFDEIDFPNKNKNAATNKFKSDYSITYNYKRLTCDAKVVKKFLKTEECQQLKMSFQNIISDVASNKESDMLFEVAFKSYGNWLISARNEIIIKIIIKLFVPNSIFQCYKNHNKKKYESGIKNTVHVDELNKIRSSIVNFKKCYENYNG